MRIFDKIRVRRILKDIREENLDDLKARRDTLEKKISAEKVDKVTDHNAAIEDGMNDFDVRRVDAFNDYEMANLVAEQVLVNELIAIRQDEDPRSSE